MLMERLDGRPPRGRPHRHQDPTSKNCRLTKNQYQNVKMAQTGQQTDNLTKLGDVFIGGFLIGLFRFTLNLIEIQWLYARSTNVLPPPSASIDVLF